ncbi:hypothetical protein G3I44_09475 [Halogeometricum borinquense]|uniref:Uncharacterized protein n=1 Tax=Halogeometricum borinquense TaxID=60847 RepID=A0A6C0UNI1_9EURY|nr:hypothetical protein [Halogeometricum borinquense]QIB74488.1 hypothetical protein G3I44_09475 [Halogeometricum borinquense]
MAEIDVDSETIVFGTDRVVIRHPVMKSLHKDDVFIVLLEVPNGTIDNRNVIGFSTSGRRLWEIEPISDSSTADQPYVNLFEENGAIWVYNPIGAKCRLDIDTGNIIKKEQKKW